MSCGFGLNNDSFEYKKIKMWSSYGLVDVNVKVINQDYVELECNINNCKIKCIDSPRRELPYEKIKHYPSTVVSLKSNRIFGKYVSKMKKNLCINSDIAEQLYGLHSVDIHFITGEFVMFFNEYFNLDNSAMSQDHLLLSLHGIRNLDNAYHTKTHMVYGSGSSQFVSMGKIDVVAHELMHGITFNIAGFEYKGETGALSEHYSDVVGCCFEYYIYQKYNGDNDISNDITGNFDWNMGEDVCRNGILRSMENPKECKQPCFYEGEFWGNPLSDKDNGYVHVNSGVLNRCFYTVAMKLGIITSLKLWIRVLLKLKTKSDMREFAFNLVLCAQNEEIEIVNECLLRVGL